MFGAYGRPAHVMNIQFKILAANKLVNRTLSANSELGGDITDEEIVSVLDAYDIVSTPEYELAAQLFLKHMLYHIVSVRQLL